MKANRPFSYNRPPSPSGVPITLNLSEQQLLEMGVAGHQEGHDSLSQLVTAATREYITARKNAPEFPGQLAAARERNDMALLAQQHPIHPSAPKDIV